MLKNLNKESEKPKKLGLNTLINLMQFDIKCFQHCQQSQKYLCFQLPDKCPSCSISFKTRLFPSPFKTPPFCLKAPVTSNKYKCLPSFSLLLQPTDGNYTKFIRNENIKHYYEQDIGDLHIGITNSNGDVFDFDQNGLSRNAIKWFRIPSIVVNLEQNLKSKERINIGDYQFLDSELLEEIPRMSTSTCKELYMKHFNTKINYAEKWNILLENFWLNKDTAWTSLKYNENTFNCLDFIINFLIELGFFDLNEECFDSLNADFDIKNKCFKGQRNWLLISLLKQEFSSKFIEPEFYKCLRFLNLLVKIKEKKIFASNF